MDRMDKRQMRAIALAKRDGLTKEQRKAASGEMTGKLRNLSDYQKADALLVYVSFRSEADTIPLIRYGLTEGKAVFAPRVSGRDMDFFRIFSLDDLRKGYQGILEPVGDISFYDYVGQFQKTLICLPGAAFDRERHRIGYGGGFYDRYLAGLEERMTGNATTVALAFDCQIFGKIPWEIHDIRPSCIVTEREIIL